VPVVAKFSRSTSIKSGIKTGPKPVNVTVFRANVVAGKIIPWPMPVKHMNFEINIIF